MNEDTESVFSPSTVDHQLRACVLIFFFFSVPLKLMFLSFSSTVNMFWSSTLVWLILQVSFVCVLGTLVCFFKFIGVCLDRVLISDWHMLTVCHFNDTIDELLPIKLLGVLSLLFSVLSLS
jgi:hypothetical protein